MAGVGIRQIILGIAVLGMLAAALVGCATTTQGSNAAGHLTVPQTVAPPDQVPPELATYVPRYAGVLDFWGFKLGPTTDPQALKLELQYSGEGKGTKLTASLLHQGKPVLSATAVPNTSVPWHWFGTAQQADLLQDLANNDIEQFDEQLKLFTQQLEIVKAPGAATAEALSEAGFSEFGTAFAVGSPNTFLTANHVVNRAGEIRLYCGRDESAVATVEADDTGNDLALLHAAVGAKAFLQLAPDGTLAVGDHVFTVGFPAWNIEGIEPKYTDGVVSALTGPEDTRNLMQISVPIQPGNSGGPLLDSAGRVQGIIDSTAAVPYFLRHAGSVPQNVNYAVPIYYVYPLVKGLPQAAPAAGMTAIQRAEASVCLVAVRPGARFK